MTQLTQKANEAKKVTSATGTETAKQGENTKKADLKAIFETTAEKRIKNHQLFMKICEKYNFLKVKSDKLNAYLVGRDALKESVIIENSDGQTFEIGNSIIISKILEVCQTELFNLLEESEKEVLNFSI